MECIVCGSKLEKGVTSNVCRSCNEKIRRRIGTGSLKCAKCNGTIYGGEYIATITKIEGKLCYICVDCCGRGSTDIGTIRTSIKKCKKCNTQMNHHRSNNDYCELCVLGFVNCSFCGENMHESDGTVHTRPRGGNLILCKKCSDNISKCDNCGNLGRKDDSSFNKTKTGKLLCRSCITEDDMVVNKYSYKPSPKFLPVKRNNNLYMGVEIEMEFQTSLRNSRGNLEDVIAEYYEKFPETSDKIYFKPDGSLSFGLELVSHPSTIEYHRKFYWSEIFTFFKKLRCKSHDTDTCGLHVHINKSYMNESDRVKLAIFVNAHANKIAALSRRANTRYAGFLQVKKGDKKKLIEKRDKYYALNWIPKNTIEFRMFKGTLNYDTFIATLEFVDSVCKFMKECPSKLLYKRNKSWKTYIEYIKENKYDILYKYLGKKCLLNVPELANDTIHLSSSPSEEKSLPAFIATGDPKIRMLDFVDRRETD